MNRQYDQTTMTNINNNNNMSSLNSRPLVRDYIATRLKKTGCNMLADSQEPTRLHQCMRLLGEEFEQRYRTVFQDLCGQLHLTQTTAYPAFFQIADEIFQDGVKWGRIVGLIAFGGALSVYCVEKEMPGLVENIIEWETTYLDTQLAPWIIQHGGWNGLVEFYEGGAEMRNEQLWPNVKMALTAIGAVAGAGLTLGFLLSKS
ncbi:bcl-2-like protein 2 [Lingula anatina]|uniref:Bcl-2-like protein 2 n=1 Tax=Lingula anatina TaxID=7574 RepID=A0A2R2MS11_LINAN|nr:bcl-2-like protein 2 [Lingula anatina]|eukprot:XP_023933050.1 bcl-2-like protein 2 [Lingula anatina]